MEKARYKITSIRLSKAFHTELKIYCALTNKTIGDFIRISVQDKINQLKNGTQGSESEQSKKV